MRYGLHQKPIQNPYRHQKTAYFKIQQATISNDKKKPAALAYQWPRDNKLQQATIRENSLHIIGKDEVGSSNLPSSSKKHRKLWFSVLFCCKNAENGASQNVGQLPDPHRDPHAERVKEYRRGGFAPSPIFLMCFFCSHHLCHKTAHRLCSFILLLPCGVGVGSQGKACIIVPQHTADRFHVHTVL